MSAGITANNDGSADITVGGIPAIEISAAGAVTIPNLVGGGGNPYVLTSYTSPGSWDVNTKKAAGLKSIKVTVVGAGGTGGTAPAPGGPPLNFGSAGGGGGAAIYYAPGPSLTPSPTGIAITIGVPGAGTSSFGAIASATAGGDGSTGLNSGGGAGGTGVGGTVNMVGTAGHGGQAGAGPGGNSFMGGGGSGGNSANSPGQPGNNYGGGGGGGIGFTGPARPGGAGAPGVIIVEEFY